jgi:hypothetical protein
MITPLAKANIRNRFDYPRGADLSIRKGPVSGGNAPFAASCVAPGPFHIDDSLVCGSIVVRV